MKRNPENVALLVEEERRVGRKTDGYMNHTFREHRQESDHLAKLGAEGMSNRTIGTVESSSWLLGRQQKGRRKHRLWDCDQSRRQGEMDHHQ